MLEQYAPVDQSYQEIAGLRPWNLLLTGSQETLEAEPRCVEPIKKISPHLSEKYQHIKITRQPDKGGDGRFILDKDGKTKETSAQDFHKSFKEITERPFEQSVNVLMDITSLELDAILHLQHYFNQPGNVQDLFALYTSPQEYLGRHEYKLRLNEIAQPPGYISLRLDGASSFPHVFILGFDTGRALRFFELFDDWKDNEKYAIMSDPSYVPDGATKVREANSWINDLEPEQIFSIEGFDPLMVFKKLEYLYKFKKRLDIIPLGPKLMLLGATRFYFSLDEEERNHIRILYDFPQSTAGITSGIGRHYLFDCNTS